MEAKKPEERKAAGAAMNSISSFVLYMVADFALIAGVVLILLGAGEYISSVVKIPGSGTVLLGVILFISGVIVLVRTKPSISIGIQQPMAPQPPPEMQQPPTEPPAGSYR